MTIGLAVNLPPHLGDVRRCLLDVRRQIADAVGRGLRLRVAAVGARAQLLVELLEVDVRRLGGGLDLNN